MVKFIPKYFAETPKQQGRLEDKFLEFANHATLISRVDYKVHVSEGKEGIYLRLENPVHHLRDLDIGIDSVGKDGKTAAVSVQTTLERGIVGMVAKINGTTYIIPEIHKF